MILPGQAPAPGGTGQRSPRGLRQAASRPGGHAQGAPAAGRAAGSALPDPGHGHDARARDPPRDPAEPRSPQGRSGSVPRAPPGPTSAAVRCCLWTPVAARPGSRRLAGAPRGRRRAAGGAGAGLQLLCGAARTAGSGRSALLGARGRGPGCGILAAVARPAAGRCRSAGSSAPGPFGRTEKRGRSRGTCQTSHPDSGPQVRGSGLHTQRCHLLRGPAGAPGPRRMERKSEAGEDSRLSHGRAAAWTWGAPAWTWKPRATRCLPGRRRPDLRRPGLHCSSCL
nr:translation initiation factor IF-2 [Oryctolagus cuniculus]